MYVIVAKTEMNDIHYALRIPILLSNLFIVAFLLAYLFRTDIHFVCVLGSTACCILCASSIQTWKWR